MQDFNVKLFFLNRKEDETGISGTGVVATGIIFPNGYCALSWTTDKTSVAFYPDIETIRAIHGHGGKTEIIQMVDYNRKEVAGLLGNYGADEVEIRGVLDKTAEYLYKERERLVKILIPKTL